MFFNDMRVTSPVFRSGNNTQSTMKNGVDLRQNLPQYSKLKSQDTQDSPMKPGGNQNFMIDRTNFFKSEAKIQKLFQPNSMKPEMSDKEKYEIINKIMQQKQEIKVLEALVSQN